MLSYVDRRSADQQIKSGQGAAPVPKRQVGREMGHGRRSVVGLDSIAYLCVESPFRLRPVPYLYMVMGSSTAWPAQVELAAAVSGEAHDRAMLDRGSSFGRSEKKAHPKSSIGVWRNATAHWAGDRRSGRCQHAFRDPSAALSLGRHLSGRGYATSTSRFPRAMQNATKWLASGRFRAAPSPPDAGLGHTRRTALPGPGSRAALRDRRALGGAASPGMSSLPAAPPAGRHSSSSSRHGPPLGDGDRLPQAVARAAWASARGTARAHRAGGSGRCRRARPAAGRCSRAGPAAAPTSCGFGNRRSRRWSRRAG